MGVNGVLDIVEPGKIAGWLGSSEQIDSVEIYVNDIFAARVKCDSARADLKELGIRKDGLGGFVHQARLKPLDIVRVFCAESGAELKGSPKINQRSVFVSYRYFRAHQVSDLLDIEFAYLDGLVEGREPHVRLAGNVFGEVVGLAIKERIDLPGGMIVLRKDKKSARRSIKAYRGFLKGLQAYCPRLLREFRGDAGFLVFELIDGEVWPGKAIHRMVCEEGHPVVDRVLTFLCDLNACNGSVSLRRVAFSVDSLDRVLLRSLGKLKGLKFWESFLLIKWMMRLYSGPKVFSHGDFHAENVLIGFDGRISVLDWDKYGFYPIGFDLACFFRNEDMYLNMEAYDGLVKEYCSRLNLSGEVERRVVFNFWVVAYMFFIKHDAFRKSEQRQLLFDRISAL